MAKKEIKYPFTVAGQLYHDHAIGDRGQEIIEKTVDEARFTGELKFERISRKGQHSVLAWFVKSKHTLAEQYYHVFLADLADMIPKMRDGIIKGTFVPTKRGADCAWKLEIKDLK